MSSSIRSVERALEILLYLNDKFEPVGVSQISKDMELNKSTVFRALQTLEKMKFVEQKADTGKYSLGVIFFSMASKISTYDFYKPYAKRLHAEFHEAVNISVIDTSLSGPYKSIIVVKEDSKASILSVSPQVGTSSYCYCSSVGKCLLAFSPSLSEDVMKKYHFLTYTKNTITSYEELTEELARVRDQGYAFDNEEQEIGLYCIGVPLLNKAGEAVAAMSVSGPSQRMKNHGTAVIVERLKLVAQEISQLL